MRISDWSSDVCSSDLRSLSGVYNVLDNKYYADWLNEQVVARLALCLGNGLWTGGDRGLIDGVFVNGSARVVGWVAAVARKSVVEGKSVSVRLDLGGRRIIKKKMQKQHDKDKRN